MIQAWVYRDDRGFPVPSEDVIQVGDDWVYDGRPVRRSLGKMGKSLRNAVTPDDICAEYGADTLRLYEMSMGPLEVSRPWETRAIVGSYRFLQRLWRNVVDEATGELVVSDEPAPEDLTRLLHHTIAEVTEDMASLKFNTALARLMTLNNAVGRLGLTPRSVVEPMILMLAPLAPHVAEELWSRLGHAGGLARTPFPVADPQLAAGGHRYLRGAGQRQGPQQAAGQPGHFGAAARRSGRRPGSRPRPCRRRRRAHSRAAPELVNFVVDSRPCRRTRG